MNSAFCSSLLKDQVILVTGGGSGMGEAIAREASELGARVVIAGRTEEKLQKVSSSIKDSGGCCQYYVLDIRDEEAVNRIIQQIVDDSGCINGLVNNAGGQFPRKIEDLSKKGFSAVVENNLVGGFLVARECFRKSFIERGGAIVNITADCSNGFPGMSHTGAARAGMENFTKSAAWEWGRHGVRVNAVAPGIINSTGLETYDLTTRKLLADSVNNIPLGRMGTVNEISSVVCFLLSRYSGFITGETIHVDGGGRFSSSSIYFPLNTH